ncbi:amidohydrolase [Candidatus Stoquefichus massiliensis]|uniref:amidohydrolase n=1 Tax=Candidatus Stoquefichus massiliensis TaxID=1470350 RepID=UPI000489D687|nr:amidohydrolase [Candidatus Stoquefichus massiliensis]
MYQKIKELSTQYYQDTIHIRRDLHKYAERGWLETRTACLIATTLEELGYQVLAGEDIMIKEARMGLPPDTVLHLNYRRAQREDANPKYLEKVKMGMTAVAGILKNGEGPTVALRFDIDALGLIEESSKNHYPFANQFSSVHIGAMHACGHDGHTAIGLTTARILMDMKEHIHGTIKLIFQPAEEGVRGAKCIAESGFLDDVDYLLAAHIMPSSSNKYDLYFGMNESFATTKLDVVYHGVSTHAAESPQFGKNALLSAATCIMNLHSIPRNSSGETRVNVGTVHAGTGRNVVPETAKLEIEVRGTSTEVNRYMEIYARDIINASALMHDTVVEIEEMGKAYALNCSEDFMNQIRKICEEYMPDLKLPKKNLSPLGGSDDFSYMMERVQAHGGQATYMKLLTPIVSSPHNDSFDFNEKVLEKGPRIFASIVYALQ